MTLSPTESCQHLFRQFWEFVEQKTSAGDWQPELLTRVRRNWEHWWEQALSPAEREQIERLTESMRADENTQEKVATWMEERMDRHFDRPGTGRLVLTQLAQLPPLSAWSGWDSYRRGVNTLIMEPNDGWSIENVKPLITVAVSKNRATDPPYGEINLDIHERAAMLAARNASLSAFRGFVFSWFVFLWALCGRKNRSRRIRILLRTCWILTGLGWALVASLLIFTSTTDLFTSLPDDHMLAVVLLPLVIVPLFGLLYVALANGYEGLRSFLCGWKWARQLKQSQLYLLLGNRKTTLKLPVKGASFGLMLALRNLLALYEAKPFPQHLKQARSTECGPWLRRQVFKLTEQPSWLWQHFFEQLATRLQSFTGTGEITNRGWIKRVQRLEDKFASSSAHPQMCEMFHPMQDEPGLRQGPGAQPVTSPDADGIRGLRLHPVGNLAQVMLAVSNLVNRRSMLGSAMMLVLSVWLGYVALPNVISIVSSAAPQIVDYRVVNDPQFGVDDSFLLVSVETGSPDEFEVYDHYEHQITKLKPSRLNDGVALARIELSKERSASSPRAIVELRRHRKLLGVSLPDKIVLAVTIP